MRAVRLPCTWGIPGCIVCCENKGKRAGDLPRKSDLSEKGRRSASGPYIDNGRVRIRLDSEVNEMGKGDAVIIPAGSVHQMENLTEKDVYFIALGVSKGKGGVLSWYEPTRAETGQFQHSLGVNYGKIMLSCPLFRNRFFS